MIFGVPEPLINIAQFSVFNEGDQFGVSEVAQIFDNLIEMALAWTLQLVGTPSLYLRS
jgi:hypothetical protein